MFRNVMLILAVLMLPVIAFGQVTDNKPVAVKTDADVTGITYWTSDTVYNIDGLVFVEDGEVLIIEPGTVIKGNTGQGTDASALVVARGGRIYAEGTATQPIIMTTIEDDVDLTNDINLADTSLARGRWGGLIILGNARINTTTGVGQIEGIDPLEPRGAYGGTDDDDNSGIVKYVSIRHGGTEIGAANEINGLTLGGVGRGTTISHVEVFYNRDDGVEFFGGTVNVDHITVAYQGDDAFDYDEGWRGAAQFVFCMNRTEIGDRAGEHDGGTSPVDGEPFATPLFSNATYIGSGTASGQRALEIRDNAGGSYMNSIFTDHGSYGLNVEESLGEPTDSRTRLSEGQIYFRNNLWYGFGNGNTAADISNSVAAVESAVFTSGNDYIADPLVTIPADRVSASSGWDPRPQVDLTALGWSWIDPKDAIDGFNPPTATGYPSSIDVVWPDFEVVDYPGAFDPNADMWICGWTALSYYSFLAGGCSAVADCDCPTDDGKTQIVTVEADVDGFTVWSRDNVYNIDGLVFVEDGDTLLIEPGTVIKGNTGQGTDASALVAARGGLIYAVGASDCPIIMTTIEDDVDLTNDINLADTSLARGRWGGLILLGNARINTTTGVGQIEGIDPLEPRGAYGGTDDDDNSGVIRFVSLRHGGTEIGAANEINGLTLGGVGRGTRVSNVEIFYNRDDGVEFFGGTVNVDHILVAYQGDDAFDYDEGWRGAAQFVFCMNRTEIGDRAGEHDGGTSPVDGEPFATPLFSNATYIGSGTASGQRALEIRDNAGGSYMNSIFTDHGSYGLNVEESLGEPTDSRTRLSEGQIYFRNNLWYGFGNGNTAADISNSVAAVESAVFTSGNDYIEDPLIAIPADRVNPGAGWDPRPEVDLAGLGWSWIDPLDVTDGFNPPTATGYPSSIDVSWPAFTAVDYPGAFDPNVAIDEIWAAGWTAAYCFGFFGDVSVVGGCCVGNTGDVDGNGNDDISDLLFLVDYQFVPGSPAPTCTDEADVDGSGSIDISDLLYLVDYQFVPGSPAPVPCN